MDENNIKLTFYRREGREVKEKTVIYENFVDDKIKKDFNIEHLWKCFEKNNKDLHCSYYTDGITNTRILVISDSFVKLQKNIIEIGMCE